MAIYPESFYRSVEAGHAYLTREERRNQKKQARKRYREWSGCSGCHWKTDPILGIVQCQKGNEPGKRGFCPDWWSDRERPPE